MEVARSPHSCQTLARVGPVDERRRRDLYAAHMRKPDWGFGLAALVAGLMAASILVLLVLGLRGLFS